MSVRAGLFGACIVMLLAPPWPSAQAAGFDPAQVPGKLPKDILPIAYRVEVRPQLETHTLEGHESIRLEFRAPAARVVLNTLGITLRDVRLDGRPVRDWHSDEAQQTTTIRLAREAAAGSHTLSLSWRGKIERAPEGMFLQPYRRPDGSAAEMLTTQFEATDARRMLPCWDEPAFRATFDLTVRIPARWQVVGNMPVRERRVQGALATVRFEPTPRMPSYLLELTAGDLGAIHGSTEGIALGVYTPRGRESEGRTALANATTILADYDEYFGYRYPLPKLDSIAIPGGFSGAMENWGAITYASETLLLSPSSTLADQQQVFAVQAHEMAHQWNGDLVTMAWWNDLWLNESFASWMAAKETDRRHPEWRWWENQDADKERAMRADSFTASHPIEQPVTDELQASAAFDPAITYSKGQAVLRMLESYLEEATFRDGIRHYIRAHALSNATTADLWKALSEASHEDVGAIASGWTSQPGFPLLSVTARCDAGGARTLEVRQHRFLLEGSTAETTHWDVPLRIRVGTGGAVQRLLMREPAQSLAAGHCGEPLSLNADGIGYFRVAYDPDTLGADTHAFERLPPGDRIALLDDQWALVESGGAPLGSFLALAEAMPGDEDPRAWAQLSAALNVIERDERGTPGHAAFVAYARSLLEPIGRTLGWDARPGEPADVRNLRREVLRELGLWGDPQILAEARRRIAAFAADPHALDPEQQAIAMPIVASAADAATFERLHAIAKRAKDQTEFERMYASLAWVQDPALAHTVAELILSPEIPPQAAQVRLEMLAVLGVSHPELAWQTFSTHIEQLMAPFGMQAPVALAAEVPELFWRALPPDELEAWIRAHVPEQLAPYVARGMQSARFNGEEKRRVVAAADAYLATRMPTAARTSS